METGGGPQWRVRGRQPGSLSHMSALRAGAVPVGQPVAQVAAGSHVLRSLVVTRQLHPSVPSPYHPHHPLPGPPRMGLHGSVPRRPPGHLSPQPRWLSSCETQSPRLPGPHASEDLGPGCSGSDGSRAEVASSQAAEPGVEWLFAGSVAAALGRGLGALTSRVVFQHQHHYLLLPAALHLRARPCERLVREPGPVSALEREEETGPLCRGRGRGRGCRGRGGLGRAAAAALRPPERPASCHYCLLPTPPPGARRPEGSRPCGHPVSLLLPVARERAWNLPFLDQISRF